MVFFRWKGSRKKAEGPSSIIRFDKGRLVQERHLLPISKVFGSWGSRLRHERSSWRDLRKPLKVMVIGTQAHSNRVLLAHHAKGCLNLCQNLWQMSKVQQRHQTVVWKVEPNDSPMAVCSVGVRDHGTILDSGTTAEIPYSRHRLLHKVGGNWNLGHHYGEERTKLCLEVHHLQVWDP